MATPQAAMKKRQIIANSNRTMFFWVAAMSAVVGICLVVSYFLAQQVFYKTKVANRLNETLSIVKQNNKIAPTLIQNVRVLETNTALASVKASPDDKVLQVILDALPADANTLALGSSIQQKIVSGVDGVAIENLIVDQFSSESDPQNNQLSFRLTVSAGDVNVLKDLLSRLERSIRVIDIDMMTIEKSQDKFTMVIDAHAYYEPAKHVELIEETVPVDEKK